MRDRSYLAIALFGAVAALTLGITPPYASAADASPTTRVVTMVWR